MKAIQQLKTKYPDIFIDDDNLYYLEGDDPVYVQIGGAKELIEDFYDNKTIVVEHSSGDPQLEGIERVSGSAYIRQEFEGIYQLALNNI